MGRVLRAKLLGVDGDIGGYRVVQELGAGGMGEVYLVQHPRLPRRDALKLLDASVSRNAQFRSRLVREAHVLATLHHPNIITIHDQGEHEGRLWLAMEYVAGSDLSDLLRERGTLTLPLVTEIVGGAAAALDYAYAEHRITHRDVKPANILVALNRTGALKTVKLADFGIAKAADEATALTSTGMTLGTMNYISPEALQGADVDNYSDQYSLGCTAFELLVGYPPFRGENPGALVLAHVSKQPPRIADCNPVLPTALNEVFARALAKEPTERYPTCTAFAAALRTAATSTAERRDTARTVSVDTPPLSAWMPPASAKPGQIFAAQEQSGPVNMGPLRSAPAVFPNRISEQHKRPWMWWSVAAIVLAAAIAMIFGAMRHTGSEEQPGGRVVSKSDVETKIKQQWNEQVPQQKAKAVACDGDLDAKVDATQHCVVTTSSGEHPVTATVTNVDGSDVNYKWHTDDN